MSTLKYSKIIQEIEAKGMMPDRPPSLLPMKTALDRLFSKHPIEPSIEPSRVIVVAGTNGKGSVCATLEALLLSAGQTVGLYTSPHLEETTERIRINQQDISKELFCEVHARICELTSDLSLSHFEILTLMAALIFFDRTFTSGTPIQWAIFEVGLGGTWDATNAIPHHTNVITSLALDHENLLGRTLMEVATNKFGIIGLNSRVIHSPLPPEIEPLAHQVADQTKSTWVESVPFTIQMREGDHTPTFLLETEWGTARLSLPGQRGAQNAATALTVFCELGFNPALHLGALNQVRWPGRMELIGYASHEVPIYLSGDHNPAGIQSLVDLLQYYPRNHLHILVGIGKDKNKEGILNPLFELPNTSIYLTQTPFRGYQISDYQNWTQQAAGVSPSPWEALDWIKSRIQPNDLILVTGSLYLVGQIRKEIRKRA